jgi:hypothetical protein
MARRTRTRKRAFEVDVNHCIPIFFTHVEDHAIPQNTGVVDDDINAAKFLQRSADNLFTASKAG